MEREGEKKIKEKNSELAPQEAVPVNVCSKWRMDVIGQPEPEREHSMFSTHTKLCITVIPSTAHRQADKGRIR